MQKTLNELTQLKKQIEKLITKWEEDDTRAKENGEELAREGRYIEMCEHHGAIRRAISLQEGGFVKDAPNDQKLNEIFAVYQTYSASANNTLTQSTSTTSEKAYEDDLARALEASRIAYEEERVERQENEHQLEEALRVSNHTTQTEVSNIGSGGSDAEQVELEFLDLERSQGNVSPSALPGNDTEELNVVINESLLYRIMDIQNSVNKLISWISEDTDARDYEQELLLKESLLLATTEDFMQLPDQAELLAEINSLMDLHLPA